MRRSWIRLVLDVGFVVLVGVGAALVTRDVARVAIAVVLGCAVVGSLEWRDRRRESRRKSHAREPVAAADDAEPGGEILATENGDGRRPGEAHEPPALGPATPPTGRIPTRRHALDEEPRQWNVWYLGRIVRERARGDALRGEELSALLMYLRKFASPDGLLPLDFDGLVRESFDELIRSPSRR